MLKCLLAADFGVSAKDSKGKRKHDTFIGTPYWYASLNFPCVRNVCGIVGVQCGYDVSITLLDASKSHFTGLYPHCVIKYCVGT